MSPQINCAGSSLTTKLTNRTMCWRKDNRGACGVFLDGITLILLIHYFRRPTDQAESFSTPYQDKTDLIRQFRICVKRFCGAELPKKMSLHQFCMGAVCVAENQPGVRLPHYLTECANGRIDSVSLPAQYFHAYLGATPILNYDNEELEVK